MNREIKFRGKSYYNEWVYGDLKHLSTGHGLMTNEEIFTYTKVNPETIGQYTGLTDKIGNKIFEGDILRLTIPDGSTRHFVVEWANEDRTLKPLNGFQHDGNPIRISGWCFNWNGHRLYPTVMDGVPDNERMEIVGNIHDNPDLLK